MPLISNAVKVLLFISDAQYTVPFKICRTARRIHLFKITVKLTPKYVTLRPSILCDILELEWNEVNMTLNEVKMKLSTSVTISLNGLKV